MYAVTGAYASEAQGDPGARPGSLIFNPPQTCHRDHFETAGSFFSVGITQGVWDSLRSERPPSRPQYVPVVRARMLAARLMRELADWDETSALTSEALCFEMIGGVLAQAVQERRRPAWLDRVCDILRESHASALRLSDAAALVGVHPHHLTRTFSAFEGCTPGDYLLAVRLEAAGRMIIGRKESLAQVALAAGFADQSHFARRFRAAYGVTPGEFRRSTGAG
jgi:AraC family transcriptional regulator